MSSGGPEMTKVQFRKYAEGDDIFGPTSWDKNIGRQVPLRLGDVEVGNATITAAEVAPDGHSVVLTIEVPDVIAQQAQINTF